MGKKLFCGAIEGEVDLLSQDGYNVLVSGVGLASSIFQLQQYLTENKNISDVIFCGSCGAYDTKKYAIGDIVYSDHFVYKELAELDGKIKIPDLIQKEIFTLKIGDSQKFLGKNIKNGVTNSTNSITIEDIEPRKIKLLGQVDFENMESFGLAYVSERFFIRFTSIFAVTNFVGKNGSKEWGKNWRECSDKLQNFLMEHIA